MMLQYAQQPSKADNDYMTLHGIPDIPRYSIILQYAHRPSKADYDYMLFHAIP